MRINETPEDHLPETFTVESLRSGGLTEAEIKALSEGDDPIVTIDDTKPADAQTAKPNDLTDTDDDGVGQPPDTGDDKEVDNKADADAASQAAAQAAEQAKAEEAARQAEMKEPEIPDIPDTKEAQAVIDGADQKFKDLVAKYDDGDITQDEFLKQQMAIANERATAQATIIQAEQALEQGKATLMEYWGKLMNNYKAGHADLWSDEHVQGWDFHLRNVTGNPAHNDLTLEQKIKLAHRNYAADYEVRSGKALEGSAAINSATPSIPKKDELEVRKDKRPEPPATLAGLNSDGTSQIEDSRFAAIDRKILSDPIQAERDFDSMTEEQQERFLTEV